MEEAEKREIQQALSGPYRVRISYEELKRASRMKRTELSKSQMLFGSLT